MFPWLSTIGATLVFVFMATASMAVPPPSGEGDIQWHKRSQPGEPATKEEKLAMELVRKREQLLKIGPYTVQSDGKRGEYRQISVRLRGGEGDVDTIRRFLVDDGGIVAFADPVYEQPPVPKNVDPKRSATALMVARQTKAGEAPNRPDLYDGFAYTAEIDGCNAVVTEKDSNYEVAETYEFDLCQ